MGLQELKLLGESDHVFPVMAKRGYVLQKWPERDDTERDRLRGNRRDSQAC